MSSGFPTRSWVGFPRNSPLETTSCGRLISGRQIFLYVPASNFVLPPRSSLPLRVLPQGSRSFYVRAERASLPPHAPDMLTVRIQAIDGTRTFTSLDPRPCRPLPPWSGAFPPPPPPALSRSRSAASSVLFPCTTPRDRAYGSYSSSLSPIGPPSPAAGGPGVSRFSRMEFLCMPGVFGLRRVASHSPWRAPPCCLPVRLTPSTPGIADFGALYPACICTCQRFKCGLAVALA